MNLDGLNLKNGFSLAFEEEEEKMNMVSHVTKP